MRSLTRGKWRVVVPLAGVLLLLLLMVLIPRSADAYGATSEVATAGTIATAPTVDLTVTALAKKKLALQVQQLQNQLEDQNNWFANNSTALIAAITALIVAIIGFYQWRGNQNAERRKEIVAQDKELSDRADAREKERAAQEKESKYRKEAQDKELRDRAEERFQAAVTALGSENEATQVGGAILLRSFLNEEDERIYGRYYTQTFDLAVAYLRLSKTSQLLVDPDVLSSLPESTSAPVPLSPLRQALIVVFKEAFPLARDWLKGQHQTNQFSPLSLDATGVKLDYASLVDADLELVWMQEASLRKADLGGVDLSGANLWRTNFNETNLRNADLRGANLRRADLSQADLRGANLRKANLPQADLNGSQLQRADLNEANLRWANLSHAGLFRADLSGADLTEANLRDTDLRGVKGLKKGQLEYCKAKGAIIDEDITTDSPQQDNALRTPAQNNDAQSQSTAPTQITTLPASTDGSSNFSIRPNIEP